MNTGRNKMNFSHWDIAVDFTGDQAAALAFGLDPAEAGYVRESSVPLYQRMEQCYKSKRHWLWDDMGPTEDGLIAKPDMLESIKLRWWASQVEPGTWNDYCQWSKDDAQSSFETQRFTRKELARWLAAINFTPIYQFDPDPSDGANTCADKLGSRTLKRWTPEKLEELKAYREKHGAKKTAAQFAISGARVRQLLPGEKSKSMPFWGFPAAKK